MIKTVYDPHAMGLKISSKSAGREVIVYCPFHNDTNASAEYNLEKGLFYCFVCGASYSVREIIDQTGGELVPLSDGTILEEIHGRDTSWYRTIFYNKMALSDDYLVTRGVQEWQVIENRILASKNTIIFPLHDKFDHEVGVMIRRKDGGQPKYKVYGTKPTIWPFNKLYTHYPSHDTLYLVEGVFGALRLEMFGLHSVATLGVGNISSVARIVSSIPDVCSIMDPDNAGRIAAGKLVLLGIPTILTDVCPDEMLMEDVRSLKQRTYAVEDVISASPNPRFVAKTLEKFYRRIS